MVMSHNLHNNLGNWCIFPENLLIYQGKLVEAANSLRRRNNLHLTHYPTQLSKKVRQQQHGSGTNFQLEITAFVCKLENESLNQQISQFVWTGLLV